MNFKNKLYQNKIYLNKLYLNKLYLNKGPLQIDSFSIKKRRRAFLFLSTGVRKSRLMSQYPEPSPSYIYPGKIPQRFHREIWNLCLHCLKLGDCLIVYCQFFHGFSLGFWFHKSNQHHLKNWPMLWLTIDFEIYY